MRFFGSKLLLVMGFLVLMTSNAFAHKLFVSAWGEEGKIIGEAAFSTGDYCKNSEVFLYDANNQLIGQAKTNEQGEFSLIIPKGDFPFTCKVNGGDGHQALCKITKQDAGVTAENSSNQITPLGNEKVVAENKQVSLPTCGPNKEEIDKLLSTKLNPIKAQLRILVKKSEGTTLKDVVGGLGWIIGLMGLAGFFYAKRKN